MALQTISPATIGFELINAYVSGAGFAVSTLDAAGEYCGTVFRVPKTGTLMKVGIRVNAVTTADVIAVSLETVSVTTGMPNAIFYRSGAATACTFQDTGDTVTKTAHGLANGDPVQFATIVTTTGISVNTTYFVVGKADDTFQVEATVGGGALALTNNGTGTYTAGGQIAAPAATTTYWVSLNGSLGIAVAAGDIVCVKCILEFVDGNLTILYRGGTPSSIEFPYPVQYVGGVSYLQVTYCNLGLQYSDGITRLVSSFPALGAAAYDGFGNNDDPERRGLVFQVPFNCRIVGCWLGCYLVGDANVILYDSDQATPLETIACDKDIRGAIAPGVRYVAFVSPHILTLNTNYRISVEPSSTTDVRLYYVDVDAAASMAGLEGGLTWQHTTAAAAPANEGSWVNTATRRPLIAIEVDQLDDGYGFPHFGDMSGGKY